jgi:hypothetical protein
MIAGTKAQAVIAIIKTTANYEYSSEITLDMAAID